MMELPHQSLSGYLLVWEKKPWVNAPDWKNLPSTEVVPHQDVKQWSILRYKTRESWGDSLPGADGIYEHSFLLSLSSALNHAILVGPSTPLVDHFMSAMRLNRLVFSPPVKVEQIVNDFTDAPNSVYVLSNIFARVDGDGNSLRTIGLWGADLADAGVFRQIRQAILPFRVEIRDLLQGHPVISLGSRGEVNFAYSGADSLKAVLKVIKFFTDRAMIEWPPEEAHDQQKNS